MQNILFFLWLLLFPLMEDIGDYIKSKAMQKPLTDEDTPAWLFPLMMIFYLAVAYLLYSK